jgi:DNA-binding IclR family transcriptional regulator
MLGVIAQPPLGACPRRNAHPTGSLAAAAQALDLDVVKVERLCADLVDAEMIERAPMQ